VRQVLDIQRQGSDILHRRHMVRGKHNQDQLPRDQVLQLELHTVGHHMVQPLAELDIHHMLALGVVEKQVRRPESDLLMPSSLQRQNHMLAPHILSFSSCLHHAQRVRQAEEGM